MHLKTCRNLQQVMVVLIIARLYDVLGQIKGTDLIVFRHNTGATLELLNTLNRVNRRMDKIIAAYEKLLARSKVEGLAAVQAERLILRCKSRRMKRKVRMIKRALVHLPWPARFVLDAPKPGA